MLTMTEINDIREAYYAKGKTISTIARDYGKDRKTVRKYILQSVPSIRLNRHRGHQ